MITILTPALWATLVLLVIAYIAFGIPGIVGIIMVGFLARHI